MTRPSDSGRLRRELQDSLDVIDDAIGAFESGRLANWQSVAIQLRKLLQSGKGLLCRVLPEATFHPFLENEGTRLAEQHAKQSDPNTRLAIFFSTRGAGLDISTDGTYSLRAPVDYEAEPIATVEWLTQWLQDPRVTIEQAITATAGDVAAHTYSGTPNPNLVKLDAIRLIPADFPVYTLSVVALGKYVSARVRELLAAEVSADRDT